MKAHDPEWDLSVQRPLSLSHPSRDDAATVSTVGMASINVKKGDGYICSGTPLEPEELGTARADSCQPRLQAASGREITAHQRSHRSSKLFSASEHPSMCLADKNHVIREGDGRI